jgi:hypothetical protein
MGWPNWRWENAIGGARYCDDCEILAKNVADGNRRTDMKVL